MVDTTRIVVLIIYVPVFIVGIMGNLCVLFALHKRKGLRTPVNIFLGNMAVSDLVFLIFSIFNLVEYLNDRWELGDLYCRIHGALMEVMYTITILTLCVVAIERYLSVCHHNMVYNQTNSRCVKFAVTVWIVAIVICSPLFYAWTVYLNRRGYTRCGSKRWGNQHKLVYYSVHTVIVYVLPLIVMFTTHFKIFKFLNKHIRLTAAHNRQYVVNNNNSNNNNSNNNENNNNNNNNENNNNNNIDGIHLEFRSRVTRVHSQRQRNRKVMNILAVVTLVFLLLWSPFVIIRMMANCGVLVDDIAWDIAQILMMVAAAINVFIYGFMNPEFRKVFWSFVPCKKS